MNNKPAPRMNQDQKRYLLQELNRLTSWGSSLQRERKRDPKPKKPATVLAWERKVERSQKRQKKLDAKYKNAFDSDFNAVRQEIYFGTAENALNKLNAFRTKYR